MKLNLYNKLINGNFDYWQRGTATTTASGYVADRWKIDRSGAHVFSCNQSTDLPPNSKSSFSALISTTTASALSAAQYSIFYQVIEGNILRTFRSKKVVFRSWFKSSKPGVYTAYFKNSAGDRVILKTFTIDAANTWEPKTFRFAHDAFGTWNYNSAGGLVVGVCLGSGTNYHGTADVWTTANLIATAAQANLGDTIGNTFLMADAVLIEDNEDQNRDAEFVYAGRDIFDELSLCQRYFEKSYNVRTPPGTLTQGGCVQFRAMSSDALWNTSFKVPKRAGPAMTMYSTITAGTPGFLSQVDGAGSPANRASILLNVGETGFSVASSGFLNASHAQYHWTADVDF